MSTQNLIRKLFTLINILVLFTSISIAQSSSSIRADGTILLNEKPFFPFGCYGVSRNRPISERLLCLRTMRDAGFNTVFFEDISTPNFGDLLDSAQMLGNIYVLVGSSNLNGDYMVTTVGKYKNKGSILGWSLFDDSDNGTISLAEIQYRNVAVKALDNKHLTFLTLTGYYPGRRNQADDFTSICDVSGYQIYPIIPLPDYDVTSSNALTETYIRTLLYVQSTAKVNRPLIMTAQTFKWFSPAVNPRYPTPEELRNMLYSGLAAGAKGILTYDFSFDLVNNQVSLWNEFKTIRTDVATLENVLLDGKLSRVVTGDQELVVSYWEYNNEFYVVVVNTSYAVSKAVSLTLPFPNEARAAAIFSRMPNTLSFSNGTFSGIIAAKEVEVYKISQNANAIESNYSDESLIKVYPNPTYGPLYFTNPENNIAKIEIINVSGTKIKEFTEIQSNSINISSLSAGIWFLQFENKYGQIISMRKFLKL